MGATADKARVSVCPSEAPTKTPVGAERKVVLETCAPIDSNTHGTKSMLLEPTRNWRVSVGWGVDVFAGEVISIADWISPEKLEAPMNAMKWIAGVVLIVAPSALLSASDEKSQGKDSDAKPWEVEADANLPAIEGAFRCEAGWFALRGNLSGPSHGVFRVGVYGEPFQQVGVAYKRLTYEGQGNIVSETGVTYRGHAFSTGYDGKNGPKYLFVSQPDHHLLSYRTYPQQVWKYVAKCTEENLLDSSSKRKPQEATLDAL